MQIRSKVITAALGVLVLAPQSAHAQRPELEQAARWFFGFPSWLIEVHGGVASQGRFLLQSLVEENGVIPQRALTASSPFTYGAAVGVTILPLTGLRLGFTRNTADLNFRDDTGIGLSIFDQDDVASISTNILALNVMRYVLPDRIRLTPYGGLGIAAVWWNLDDDRVPLELIAGGDDTRFRLAGQVIMGMQYRFEDRWLVRLEAKTYSIGNPFTGEESYIPVTGFTVDEPTRVRQTQFLLAVAYMLSRPKSPLSADR